VVVVNPERTDVAEELLARLEDDAECDVDVERPTEAAELGASVRRGAERADTVAVVGGDGTQRTAADALVGTGVALAVVPGGTVNLLARILGVDSVESAAAAIVDGSTRTVDLGMVGGSTFVLNASSGFDADVMRRVDDGAKRWGRFGYLAAGMRELRSARVNRVTVTVDGQHWFEGPAMTVMVTNFGQRGSADFIVAPGSAPDDGLLDVVVQRCDSALSMARTIWVLARRREPRREDLVVAHGRRIDVRWERLVATQRDGDATGEVQALRYEIGPDQLLVRCPPGQGGGGS
jgi:diacylglycerol kinase (ATP)